MASTVVPTTEEDLLLSAVRFTADRAWDDAGPEGAEPQVNRLWNEAEDCMIMGRWLDLSNPMITSADVVSSRVSAKGLIHEDCLTKMRIMSLIDLASKASGSIPYSLIKDTLHINEDDVENWVVKAITSKLLDCKIDQLNQTVHISRCTEPVFGLKQWQSLHSKLQVWRANIAKVVNTIQANKASKEGGYTQDRLF